MKYKKYVLNYSVYLVPVDLNTPELEEAISIVRRTTSGDILELNNRQEVSLTGLLHNARIIRIT